MNYKEKFKAVATGLVTLTAAKEMNQLFEPDSFIGSVATALTFGFIFTASLCIAKIDLGKNYNYPACFIGAVLAVTAVDIDFGAVLDN